MEGPSRRAARAAPAWALSLLALSIGSPAPAQPGAYPNRSVRLVVPFEPGGSTDITARLVAQKLGERLGQTFVIENRAGAGGNLGTDVVAKAVPDGYTLLWANVAPVAINPSLYKKLPYDPVKDFAPITLATVFPNVIVVKPELSGETMASFIRKAPNEYKSLLYGSAGNGSSTHLAAEWLKSITGAQWQHVPYKGGGPALVAVAASQIDFYFSSIPAALPFIARGQLKALATTGRQRDPALPDVPTVAELGPRDYDVVNWNGLLAPARTPQAIVEALNKATVDVLESPELKSKLQIQGAQPAPMTTRAFAEFIRSETIKWARVVKTAHASID